jgi:cytochrome b561
MQVPPGRSVQPIPGRYSLYNPAPVKSARPPGSAERRLRLAKHVGLYLAIVIPGLVLLGYILSNFASKS